MFSKEHRLLSTKRPDGRPNQPVPDALSCRVKRPGTEADYWPSTGPKSKMNGALPLLCYVFVTGTGTALLISHFSGENVLDREDGLGGWEVCITRTVRQLNN